MQKDSKLSWVMVAILATNAMSVWMGVRHGSQAKEREIVEANEELSVKEAAWKERAVANILHATELTDWLEKDVSNGDVAMLRLDALKKCTDRLKFTYGPKS